MTDIAPARSRLVRWLYRGLAGLFIGLAAAGVVLPVLPTTPFLIVAAWAAGKSSPALRERLRQHPRYGPALRRWQDHGAISRRAKIAAISLMTLSWALLWFTINRTGVIIAVGIMMAMVAVFIASRPEGRRRSTGTRN
ncbi:DUF454 domain-containing protein [Salinisphaera sp. Q1T1-3]|nr:DUF454 domain-containing protein [Salinisphaera sp. Q1T1-3]